MHEHNYAQSHKIRYTHLTVIFFFNLLYKYTYYLIFIIIMKTLTRKFTLHHNESFLYDRGMNQQEKRCVNYAYSVFFKN